MPAMNFCKKRKGLCFQSSIEHDVVWLVGFNSEYNRHWAGPLSPRPKGGEDDSCRMRGIEGGSFGTELDVSASDQGCPHSGHQRPNFWQFLYTVSSAVITPFHTIMISGSVETSRITRCRQAGREDHPKLKRNFSQAPVPTRHISITPQPTSVPHRMMSNFPSSTS